MTQEAMRSFATANRGWRGQQGARQPQAGSRLLRRLFFTALGLALLGLFAWILVRWWFLPQVYLVGLPVVDYDVLAVPPIAHAREDLDDFVETSTVPQGLILQDLQTSDAMATLGLRLQGIVRRSRDTLILYIVAQGASDDGHAYLLCSDYMRGPRPGRVLVSDLLRQVQQCPAGLKLLLLDAEHLPADPRLGMVVNEFSRLVEAEVRAIDDPRLWVLLANQPLEVSRVSHALGRSVFGHFVAAGLRGAADGNGNRVVELDELYQYVRAQVAEAALRESGGHETQTPVLLQGGVGRAAPPAGLALLPVRKPFRSKAGAAPPAPQEATSPPATTAPPVEKLLQAAWALRDRIDSRKGAEPWTPADWAPHLWSEYQQLLLGYELQSRAGAAYRAGDLVERLQTDILPLAELIDRGTIPEGMGNSTILARLAAARGRFLAAQAAREKTPPVLQIVENAVQARDDLIERSREYVRWHAVASRRSPRELALWQPLAELLENRLPQLIALLDALQTTNPAGELTVSDREVRLKELTDCVRAIDALRVRIEDEGIQKLAQDLLADPTVKDWGGQVDDLLATTIVSGPLRRQLLDAIAKQGQRLSAAEADAHGQPGTVTSLGETTDVASDGWRWERLVDQCRLEAALVALADPDLAARLRPKNDMAESGAAQTGLSEESRWQNFRATGKALGAFYQGLPTRIQADMNAADTQVRPCARLLRLIDPRDAAKIDDASAILASLALPKLPAPIEMPQIAAPAPTPAAPPDVVDLVVQGVGITVESEGPATACIRLRPFPNRVTNYRVALVNRSRRARQVSAQLFVLPESRNSHGPGNYLPLDTFGNIRPGVQKLYDVQLALPAEERPVPIPWMEPKPAAQNPGTANPSPAPPAVRPSVPSALACVVQDVADARRQWTRCIEVAPLAPRDYLDPIVSYSAARRRIVVQLRPRQRDSDGQPNTDLLPPLAPEESIKVVWETAGLLEADTEMNDRAELVAPSYTADLFAEVAPRPGRILPVRLTVDGYPRAFVYQVKCDQDWQRVDRERSLRQIRITAPAEGSAFRAPLDSLPMEFQVDAPEDAFQDPGDVVEVGIDESGARRLIGGARFHADRQTEIIVEEPQTPGILRFTAHVHDFRVMLSPGGLRNKKVDLVARLLLANRSIASDRLAAEGSASVVLDGAPPEMEIDTPAASVVQGDDFPVTARTVDLSGVVKVEFGFDLDGSGELSEKEKPKVLRQPDGQRTTWSTALPTKELEPGRYSLLVRATDRVGLSTKHSRPVTVLVATKPAAGSTPTGATIAGQVVLVDRPCPNFNVQLDGGERSAVTDDNGRFVFKDVAPGKHKLHAKGTALNRFREATTEIVAAASGEPVPAVIRLE